MSTDQPQGAGAAPSPEELAAMMAERLARTPVRDVLLQSMATFIDMAGIRLGMGPTRDEARDLTQARQAIEALRALLEVAERELGAAQVRPFREPLAVLQMAYARAVEEPPAGGDQGGGTPPPGAGSPPPGGEAPRGRPAPDPASRLWVPPGTPRPGGGAAT
ncbi:DUF1844 domain-containing protein [Miltoncostaea marina]|uniref:DUF1844 domain-containing protein n=1 Tax=Miltoncostaea marina TaxID=2843215 RepID=UPI001C3C2F9E|nr:DUF1844 domain-containing protein [Miltoncostaea marina]